MGDVTQGTIGQPVEVEPALARQARFNRAVLDLIGLLLAEIGRLRRRLREVDAVVNHGANVEQAYRGLMAEKPGHEVHGSRF